MTAEKSTPRLSAITGDSRGVWAPPVLLVVVALLAIAIGIGGYYVSISSIDPFDTDRELLVESNTSLVMEGESVRITVRDANTGAPIESANITVGGTKTNLDSSPVLNTDENGQVTFDFGPAMGEVTVDWPGEKSRDRRVRCHRCSHRN